jgi:ABC-type bacteriocin/lantibiotic exporter with double-glycine peptidase domain
MSNLTTDSEILRDSYFYILLKMYSDFLRCAVAIGALVWISPILGIFVIVTSLVQTLVPILYAKRLEREGAEYSDAQETHMRVLKENLSAFLTAKTFHMEDKLEENYDNALRNVEERRRKMKFTKEWTSSLSYVFNQIAHLGVFLMGAVLSIKGVITVAEVVAASELIVYISYPILWLTGELTELRIAKTPGKKLQAILDEPEDLGGDVLLPTPSGQISVNNLHFSYGGREILSGITYDFQPGKKYLIIGASGSGKSTFLNLVAGLRDDYTGEITLGGADLRSVSRKSLTQSLCVINQEPFLFDDTLYNNVCLYDNVSEEKVTDALCRVELDGLLKELPNGVHTSLRENAASMSGGEKQRVVIARALVRSTPVLLLDESTSHLDPVTAAGIERLVLALDGVTVLLVSHNATETAKNLSDVVLEMKGGNLLPV